MNSFKFSYYVVILPLLLILLIIILFIPFYLDVIIPPNLINQKMIHMMKSLHYHCHHHLLLPLRFGYQYQYFLLHHSLIVLILPQSFLVILLRYQFFLLQKKSINLRFFHQFIPQFRPMSNHFFLYNNLHL